MASAPDIDGPRKILIADDEHLMAAGIAASIQELGHEVLGPTADGEAAVSLARKEHADLALLDICMPRRDGIDTARTLWSELHIPCVIVSAYADNAYVKGAQQTGVFGYLLKPVTSDSLRTTIAVAWSRAGFTTGLQSRVTQLETTLENRKVIEQAKWRLVQDRGMSEPDAHGYLQRTSRNARRPVVEVARDVMAGIIETASTP